VRITWLSVQKTKADVPEDGQRYRTVVALESKYNASIQKKVDFLKSRIEQKLLSFFLFFST
jgi:hypothetical protein